MFYKKSIRILRKTEEEQEQNIREHKICEMWKLDRRKVFWEKKEELGTYDIVQQEQEQAIFAD